MTLIMLPVLIVVGIIVVWLLTVRMRLAGNPEDLIERLRATTKSTIMPFSDGNKSQPVESKHEFWEVYRICRDGRILVEICGSTTRDCPEDRRESYLKLWVECLMLRTCLLGSLAEIALRKTIINNLPQFFPRMAATIYRDMRLTVFLMLSVHNPEIIEKATLFL